MKWNPKKLSPRHLEILARHANLAPHSEIAEALGVTYQTVVNVVNSEAGQEWLALYSEHKLDVVKEVTSRFQAVAALIADAKIDLALTSKDERVKNTAQTDCLRLAGVEPSQKLDITIEDKIREKYLDMTEEQIREELRKEMLFVTTQKPTDDETVH